jgi:hypothetical protein
MALAGIGGLGTFAMGLRTFVEGARAVAGASVRWAFTMGLGPLERTRRLAGMCRAFAVGLAVMRLGAVRFAVGLCAVGSVAVGARSVIAVRPVALRTRGVL